MKNSILIVIASIVFLEVSAQPQIGFEQNYYIRDKGTLTVGPIARYQHDKNWYVETRYNYEEIGTVSFYLGRAFTKEGDLTYSIIPIAGGLTGKYKGYSAGVNINMEYKKLFFESQSQYTYASASDEDISNFVFSWSELGYQPLNWFYAGVALQHTYLRPDQQHLVEPGVMIGFSIENWTFPLYSFNPLGGRNEKFFVVGIAWEWGN
jgi:hypothetical protein